MNLKNHKEKLDSSLSARFVFPVIGENMFTIAVSLVIAQVNSTISASALAAIGIANSVLNVIIALFSVVTSGTVMRIARQIGARDTEAAADTLEQSLLISVTSTLVLTAAGLVSAGGLMKLLMPGAEASLYKEAVRYYRIVLLSLMFQIVQNMLSGVSRSLGDSKAPLIATVFMNIMQVLLAMIMINAAGMEELGAALAIVGCRFVGMSVMLYAILGRHRTLPVMQKNMLKPKWETIKGILQIGLPISIESIFIQLGYLVASSMSIALGTFRSTVYQILNTLSMFTSIPQSICNIITMTAVGHLLGAGREKDSRKAANQVLMIGLVTSGILVAVLLMGGRFFVGIYSKDVATIERTVTDLWMMIPYTFVCIVVNCTEPQLRTGGDVKFVMFSTLIAVWLVRLPLTYLFCFILDMGEMGIYAANTVALLQRGLVSFIRRCGRKWIRKMN